MRPGRVIAIIVGALLALPALGVFFGGAALTVGAAVEQRDHGYFDETLDRLSTATPAITTAEADFEADSGPRWVLDFLDVSVRLQVDAVDAAAELFVGIGPANDVEAFLSGVARDEITEVDFRRNVSYRTVPGGLTSDAPGEQGFWAASASGGGRLALEWDVVDGDWVVVLMNGDGSPGILADVTVGVRSGALLGIGIGMLVIGALLLAAAVAIIVAGTRRRAEPEAETAAGTARPRALEPRPVAASPVRLEARVDSPLSPWLWLVKWFLAIPHFILLAILWVVSAVLTVLAGLAILFTGEYPRGIFDFNVGVMRWSWRVVFYAASGGLGTDRYPPFTLGEEPDYPATLDIAYPGKLSRGLVLVKWWLLAIPHYLVLAFMVGGGIGWWWDDAWGSDAVTWAGGLLGILVLIAAVILLFTSRYPEPLFDLIIGLNRWAFRVFAYTALMTDEYPPFRLDQGGREPVPAVEGEPLSM
jgi:hypothetical protein